MVRIADQMVIIAHRQIVETGTRAAPTEACGLYFRMSSKPFAACLLDAAGD